MSDMIIAEIGDFERFSTPDKILAYAGLSPSTYQSGHLLSTYAHMENEALATCDMLYLMLLNMFAIGIHLSVNILPKSKMRANITMLLYLMLQKDLCD